MKTFFSAFLILSTYRITVIKYGFFTGNIFIRKFVSISSILRLTFIFQTL